MSENIEEMVKRFLGWRLPDDFSPDAGIKFTPPHEIYSLVEDADEMWPTGTNLLNYRQAEEMIRYILGENERNVNTATANKQKNTKGQIAPSPAAAVAGRPIR